METLAKPTFRHDVQGLRAIAVVLVVLYHAELGFRGGFVGVDAFFVLSGFVITRRLRWEVATSGTIDVLDFMQRRIARILPAAGLMTAVVLIANTYLGPIGGRSEAGTTAMTAALINANHYLAFGQTGQSYFDPLTEQNPFLHTWSLSVEEQFYLVLPLLVLATLRWSSSREGRTADSSLRFVLGAVALASFLASLVVIRLDQTIAFYLAPFRAWEFLVGAQLVWIEGRTWKKVQLNSFAVSGFVLLLASGWFFQEGESFPGLLALVPVAGTALLLLAGSGEPIALLAPLTRAIPSFLGRISYAWYLWHWPLLVFAKAWFVESAAGAIGAIAISLVIAAMSTSLFEEPIRSGAYTRRAGFRVVLAVLMVTVGATTLAGWLRTQTEQAPAMDNFALAFRSLGPGDGVCASWLDPVADCSTDVLDENATVMLVGDSTALQLRSGAFQAAESLQVDLTLAYQNSCPTFGVETNVPTWSGCVALWDTIFEEIEQSPPDVAVVAIALDSHIRTERFGMVDTDGSLAFDSEGRAELLEAGLVPVIERLQVHVDQVMFVGITPKFPDWFPYDCSFVRWSQDSSECGLQQTWEQVEEQRSEGIAIQRRLEEELGIEIIDLDHLLCNETGCSTNDGNDWLFRDGGHLTVAQSDRSAAAIEAAIAEALAR